MLDDVVLGARLGVIVGGTEGRNDGVKDDDLKLGCIDCFAMGDVDGFDDVVGNFDGHNEVGFWLEYFVTVKDGENGRENGVKEGILVGELIRKGRDEENDVGALFV